MRYFLGRPRVTFWDSFNDRHVLRVERNDDEFRVILNVGSSNRTQASFILQPQDVRRLADTLSRMEIDINALTLCERDEGACEIVANSEEEEA